MGYLDDSLKKLYEEFKVVFDQDSFLKFRFLFEEKCTAESMPNLFNGLIGLARYLIRELQVKTTEKERYFRNEERKKRDEDHFSDIKSNKAMKIKSGRKPVL